MTLRRGELAPGTGGNRNPYAQAEYRTDFPRNRTSSPRGRKKAGSFGAMAAKSKRRKDEEPGARQDRPGGAQAKVVRRKSCLFCKDKVREVDYKNVEQLRRYTSDRGKIRSRRMSGACRRHQRQLAVAIKRAREMALLPYVAEGSGPPSRSRSGERR